MSALIPLLFGDSLIQILAGAEAICTLEAGLAVVEGTRRAMPKQVGGSLEDTGGCLRQDRTAAESLEVRKPSGIDCMCPPATLFLILCHV